MSTGPTELFNTEGVFTVKKVLTGSSIIIRGKPNNGPPPQMTVQLLFLKPSTSQNSFNSSVISSYLVK